MKEFKVAAGLESEISSLESTGQLLNDSIGELTTDGVSTLKASIAFVTENQAIKDVIDLYKSLALKDAADLTGLKATAETMDSEMSVLRY